MFDDVMDPNDAGLLELTRRLEAYADVRLSPSVAATISIRASVLNAAHRRAALIAADVSREAAATTSIAAAGERSRSRRWYRPAAAFMAASLTLAMLAGTVYGAKAGGPFYESRLWIEAANLPTNLVARAHAESARLDARIAEAQQASVNGDAPGAEAALAAYAVIVVEAVEGTAGDPTASATIEISVTRHVAVLTQLAGTVPAPARAAIQKALVSSSEAIEELEGQSTQGNDHRADPSGSSGGAAEPGAGETARPSQATGPARAADDVVVAAPADPATPEKTPPARDHTAPPPGRTRGGGGGHSGTGQPAHPKGSQSAPAAAAQDKSEELSAP